MKSNPSSAFRKLSKAAGRDYSSHEPITATKTAGPHRRRGATKKTSNFHDAEMNTASTTTSPVLPANPGDPQGLVKILLSRPAGDALAAVGPCLCHSQFAPHPSPPSAQGRQVLICLPVSWKMLNDIALLVEGKATIRRIRESKPTTASTPPIARGLT